MQCRSFPIRWRNTFSDTNILHKDLSQGSVRSPNLFVIFMEIFLRVWRIMLIIFADNIFVHFSHLSMTYIQTKIQNIMEPIYSFWLDIIYLPRTKSAIINLSNKKLIRLPCISYAGIPLTWHESIKHLSIQFAKNYQNGHIVNNLGSKALKKLMVSSS